MTAVVGIEVGAEIEAGGRPAPEQSQAVWPGTVGQVAAWPGQGQSTNRFAVTEGAPFLTSASSSESFRSRWQTAISSLSSERTGLTEEETAGAGEAGTDARAVFEASSGDGAATSASDGARTAQRFMAAGQEVDSAASATRLSSAGSQAEVTTTRAAAVTRQWAETSEDRASDEPANAASDTRAVHSDKSATRKADSSGTASTTVAESAPAVPLAMAAPVTAAIGTNTLETQTGALPADLAAASSAKLTQSLLPDSLLVSGGLVGRTEPASLKENEAADRAATLAQTGRNPTSATAMDSQTAGGISAAAVRSGQTSQGLAETAGLDFDEVPAQTTGGQGSSPSAQTHISDEEEQRAAQQSQSRIEGKIGSKTGEVLAALAPGNETRLGNGTDQGTAASDATVNQSLALPVSVGQPGLIEGKQAVEQTAPRNLRVVGTSEVVSQGEHVSYAQSDGLLIDTSTLARNPGEVHAGVNAVAVSAGSSVGEPGEAGARETFAALDAGTGVGTPGWTHAGGQRAEAGFQDPALGWVGVRADLSGGSVHAALMPGSAEAAQALSVHLAGLNAYLVEQHTPVATLTLAAPGGSGVETGTGQSMQQGAGQNAGRNTSTEPQSSAQPSTATIPAVPAPGAAAESGGFDAIVYAGEMRGRHISVMA